MTSSVKNIFVKNESTSVDNSEIKERVYALSTDVIIRNPHASANPQAAGMQQSSGSACDDAIDKYYNVDKERYEKYRRLTKKYFADSTTSNPNLNSSDNTVCYKENESEHSKNSDNLYQNNTRSDES